MILGWFWLDTPVWIWDNTHMFEINITWWKMEGEPDPDETPWWTRASFPDRPGLTPARIVEVLCGLFAEEQRLDAEWWENEYTGEWNQENSRPAFSGGLERPGETRPGEPQFAFDKFPEPFGEEARFVPAMRLRFMAYKDSGGEFHGINNRIQKAFGLRTYGLAAAYEHSALWLAKKLEAVVEWRDRERLAMYLPDGTPYEGFTEAEDANGNIVKTDTEKNLRKKLEDFMPIYRLKRAVMGE